MQGKLQRVYFAESTHKFIIKANRKTGGCAYVGIGKKEHTYESF